MSLNIGRFWSIMREWRYLFHKQFIFPSYSLYIDWVGDSERIWVNYTSFIFHFGWYKFFESFSQISVICHLWRMSVTDAVVRRIVEVIISILKNFRRTTYRRSRVIISVSRHFWRISVAQYEYLIHFRSFRRNSSSGGALDDVPAASALFSRSSSARM